MAAEAAYLRAERDARRALHRVASLRPLPGTLGSRVAELEQAVLELHGYGERYRAAGGPHRWAVYLERPEEAPVRRLVIAIGRAVRILVSLLCDLAPPWRRRPRSSAERTREVGELTSPSPGPGPPPAAALITVEEAPPAGPVPRPALPPGVDEEIVWRMRPSERSEFADLLARRMVREAYRLYAHVCRREGRPDLVPPVPPIS